MQRCWCWRVNPEENIGQTRRNVSPGPSCEQTCHISDRVLRSTHLPRSYKIRVRLSVVDLHVVQKQKYQERLDCRDKSASDPQQLDIFSFFLIQLRLKKTKSAWEKRSSIYSAQNTSNNRPLLAFKENDKMINALLFYFVPLQTSAAQLRWRDCNHRFPN